MTAVLLLDSWAGRQRIACEIVGETRTRYHVRLAESCTLPGRRQPAAGDVVTVPKDAVQVQAEVQP